MTQTALVSGRLADEKEWSLQSCSTSQLRLMRI